LSAGSEAGAGGRRCLDAVAPFLAEGPSLHRAVVGTLHVVGYQACSRCAPAGSCSKARRKRPTAVSGVGISLRTHSGRSRAQRLGVTRRSMAHGHPQARACSLRRHLCRVQLYRRRQRHTRPCIPSSACRRWLGCRCLLPGAMRTRRRPPFRRRSACKAPSALLCFRWRPRRATAGVGGATWGRLEQVCPTSHRRPHSALQPPLPLRPRSGPAPRTRWRLRARRSCLSLPATSRTALRLCMPHLHLFAKLRVVLPLQT
jgi:hypothetical protein